MSRTTCAQLGPWLIAALVASGTALAAPTPAPTPTPTTPTAPTAPTTPVDPTPTPAPTEPTPTPAPTEPPPTAPAPATLDVDATLPPSLQTGTFKLKISIDGVPAALMKNAADDPQDPRAQLAARLVLTLPDVSLAEPVPVAAADGTVPGDSAFVLSEYQPHDELTNPDGTHFYEYYLELKETTPGALAEKAPLGELNVAFSFYLGGHAAANLVVKGDKVKLDQEPSKRSATPDTPGALPVTGGLQILWEPKAPIKAANGKTYPGEPDTLNVYVVSPTLTDGAQLPAKRRNYQDDTGDVAASCTLYPGPGACVVCPDDGDYYLDSEAAAKVDGIQVLTVPSLDGLATFSGLKAGGKYEVFLQYAPKNLNVSQCLFAYPL